MSLQSSNFSLKNKLKKLPTILENSEEIDDDKHMRQNSFLSTQSSFKNSDSNFSNLSLQSSNKSDDDYIIDERDIYTLLKKLNKLALEQHNLTYSKIKEKELLLLKNKINIIKTEIDEKYNDLVKEIVNTNIDSSYVQRDIFGKIRLRRVKNLQDKEIYKTYKNKLNLILKNLDNILKHVKTDLTAIYILSYKEKLINKINEDKQNIKFILSELLAYYNEELPFYRKKWWGGNKTQKRKWSNKYKKSINCKNPKGFSQKQYCKYGRTQKRH